jgi:nucleoside-diphosphate-sugar epimerase
MNKLKNSTVLITGGTGFVGGRLVEKLVLEGQASGGSPKIRVLIRNFGTASRLARFPIEMIGGDIQDEEAVQQAVQGCDVVFHCAHDSRLSKGPQKQMASQGTHNVCQAILRENASRQASSGQGMPVRMVHVSTFSVYGPTKDGDLTESTPWQTSNHPYVLAKRDAERLVLDQYKQNGLPVVVLQPTIIYGPFSKPWTIGPVQALKTGRVPLVDGGTGTCNAVYIDDVIDAMILAATQPDVTGEVFLISGAETISWKEFYSAFETVLGVHATVEVSSDKLASMHRAQIRSQSLTTRVKDVLWNRQTIGQILRVPVVHGSLMLAKRAVPESRRHSLKAKFLGARTAQGSSQPMRGNGQTAPGGQTLPTSSGPIHVPDETLLALFKPQTRVRIDKARELLGYEPAIDFEHGMDLTAQFIHWANLA